jgi:SAM-dependent methyltransferase
VDEKTRIYYESAGAELAERYESVASPLARYFQVAFAPGSRILDVGAGSGRDLAALRSCGYDAFGVEPSAALRAAAYEFHPELAGRIEEGGLPSLGMPFGGEFDGLLCSAVLMHLEEADLFDAAFALRRVVKKGGRLLISLPNARSDVDEAERDANGRLFKPYRPEYIQLLFERIGWRLTDRWSSEDALQRTGTSWYTLSFRLATGQVPRAVDQIEAILNRDRKVATYKLALIRALAEMATQEPRVAVWCSGGQVAIPMDAIAQRWLLYYWPIFASGRFVPQVQAEASGGKPVAFRAAVSTLMQHFAGQGEHSGLTAWQLAQSSGQLSAELTRARSRALAAISSTIRDGPVAHSGLSSSGGAVFSYNAGTRRVLMAAEIWHELTLLGHWIVDAVVIRWAALTERFSVREIHSGDVLRLLLARPDPERSTALARAEYMRSGVQHCAWSHRPITSREFAVDHIIPFSLWGNNDLWNLLPVHPQVNGDKSDKLPATELLHERRVELTTNWQLLREALPGAFDRQAQTLLGRRISGPIEWKSELFDCLRQAVELTSVQRGVERWRPRVVSRQNEPSG